MASVLKGVFSETAYVYLLTCQIWTPKKATQIRVKIKDILVNLQKQPPDVFYISRCS